MRLLIISNMAHYQKNGRVVGWGPTVEEINHLASLFEEVRHIGCLHPGPAPESALPYNTDKITLIPVPPAGGDTLRDKIEILKLTTCYIKTIWKALATADVVHLRCPANIPLIALILLIFRRRPAVRWAKYAGNWVAGSDYPFFYRLQRWLLVHDLPGCYVTINGEWRNQKPHVITFHNPCLTMREIHDAAQAARHKKLRSPVELIFVGALNERKGVGRLLQIADRLNQEQVPFVLNILGDGPGRQAYQAWCTTHDLTDKVNFQGWVPKPELKFYYQNAHINLLPSESEGWPKVLSEGMAYGVVPVAGAVASIPQILDQTKAGISVPHDDTEGFVNAVKRLITDPVAWEKYARNALAAAPDFTYENYLSEVKHLFKEAWNIKL